MVPNQTFDKPGKFPFMDMQLVPKYADEGGGGSGGVQISPNIVQGPGLRIAPVELGRFSQPIEAMDTSVLTSAMSLSYRVARADLRQVCMAGRCADVRVEARGWSTSSCPNGQGRRRSFSRWYEAAITIAAQIAGAFESLDVREGMTVSAGATLVKTNGLEGRQQRRGGTHGRVKSLDLPAITMPFGSCGRTWPACSIPANGPPPIFDGRRMASRSSTGKLRSQP